MAIKISNTTVVNDSRELQNIASLDSVTVTTFKNAGIGGTTFVKKTANYTITLRSTKMASLLIPLLVLLPLPCQLAQPSGCRFRSLMVQIGAPTT